MEIKKEQNPLFIGPYLVVEEVGSGGLGRVFKAREPNTGAIVAIKVLHEKYYNNPTLLGIFHRELMIMAALHHKNIVAYLSSNLKPPLFYIVTEFVDGWSGYRFMKMVKKVPPLVGVSILMDIMQGIDHLHLHDIIHSDLSSANYLLDVEGKVYVTDFGLSCVQNIEDHKDHMIGTPGYHSPEHIQQQPIGPQSDIYCAGIILFELLTGQKPVVPNKDRKVTLSHMKNINFDLIQYKDRKMKNMVKKLLKKMLEVKPNRRLQSAEEVMILCYQILKYYNIKYTKYAIRKYLADGGLVRDMSRDVGQDIYQGL